MLLKAYSFYICTNFLVTSQAVAALFLGLARQRCSPQPVEPLTPAWHVQHVQPIKRIDLLQMHFGSRRPNQQTKAKHEHKSFQNCLAKWGDVDFFLQETDEVDHYFGPLGVLRWSRAEAPRHDSALLIPL